MLFALLLVFGCEGQVERTELASPVELDTSLVQAKVKAGEVLVLRACVRVSEAGWSWAPAFPQVEGLEPGQITSQVQGQVSCLERPYAGKEGGYVFPPVQVQGTGPEGEELMLAGPRLYGDIGEPAATSDLGELQPQPDRRWFKGDVDSKLLLAVPVLALGLLVGGWLWLGRRESEPAAQPALPPGEQALQDWSRARDNPSLSDQEKGQALSSITRRYLTHVGAPQALKRTTAELLAELDGDPSLGEWCGVLEHLLSAADTVKFAGGSASPALLEQWSEGLSGMVNAHRPPPKAEQI